MGKTTHVRTCFRTHLEMYQDLWLHTNRGTCGAHWCFLLAYRHYWSDCVTSLSCNYAYVIKQIQTLPEELHSFMSQLSTNSYQRIPVSQGMSVSRHVHWEHSHTISRSVGYQRPSSYTNYCDVWPQDSSGYGLEYVTLHIVGELPSHSWRLCGATEGQMTRLLASKSGLVNLLSSLGRLTHDHKDIVFCCSFSLHLFKKERHY